MNWFWLAVIPASMWAASNHIDKYLLSKYFKEVNIVILLIFSCLIGLPFTILIWLLSPNVFSIDPFRTLLLMANGAFYILGYIPYYMALEEEDASVVVPVYQTIPVFVYFLGLVFLKETLSIIQITASMLIMIGAIGISLDIQSGKVKFRKRGFFLMLLASVFVALNVFFYKVGAIEEEFWTTIFWNDLGMIILGVGFFLVPKYRQQFFRLFRGANKLGILAANGFNEVVNIIADLVFRFASLLAPLALVQVASNGLQPFFVLAYGVLLTLFFPQIAKENVSKNILIQKVISLIILFAGTYFLNQAS